MVHKPASKQKISKPWANVELQAQLKMRGNSNSLSQHESGSGSSKMSAVDSAGNISGLRAKVQTEAGGTTLSLPIGFFSPHLGSWDSVFLK